MKKKLNDKSKGEQLFILIIIFAAIIGIFCLSGCGGSCELPSFGCESNDQATIVAFSLPGCGGCLSSERGCDTACYPQSCKTVLSLSSVNLVGCDIQYYGDGCLGCGQREKSCYMGCLQGCDSEHNAYGNGFFYGSNASDEHFIGCANGCGGCIGTNGTMHDILIGAEYLTGTR